LKRAHGLSIIALAAGLSPAHAQNLQPVQQSAGAPQQKAPTSQTDGSAADIVVTARRRDESLQKVPISVTAIGSQEIERRNLTTLDDTIRLSPSVQIKEGVSDPFLPRIFFRGNGTDSNLLSLSPAIGVYVDDVYFGIPTAVGGANLQDVQNVQVLKGPQGTLYGRNSTGGAVKVTTNKPSYDGFSGNFTAGYGNYNQFQISGFVNVPLVSDKLALRVSGQRITHSGYGYDSENDNELMSLNSWNVRAALLANPTERLTFILRGDYLHSRSGGVITNLDEVTPNFVNSPTSIPLGTLSVGLQAGILTANDKLIALGAAKPADASALAAYQARANSANALFRSYLNQGEYNVNYAGKIGGILEVRGGSLTAKYDLTDEIYIQSITAYHNTIKQVINTQDGTPFGLIFGDSNFINLKETSQEIQLAGSGLDQKLNFTAGGFYYNSSGRDIDDLDTAPLALSNPTFRDGKITRNSYSGYGQATFAILTNVHLTGGLRYTDEKFRLETVSTKAGVCQIPVALRVNGGCNGDFPLRNTNLSYSVGIDWSVMPNLLIYFTNSTGFKAGGVNEQGTLNGGFIPFAPEKVRSYEFGAKGKWFGGMLTTNLALYQSDYDGLQRNVTTIDPITLQLNTAVTNAASARVRGVEFETTFRPVRNLVLQGSGSYTDPKYEKYINNGVDLSANRFPGVSTWQGIGSIVYTIPASWGRIDLGADYNYQSSVNYAPDSRTIFSADYTTQKAFGLWNASVSFNVPDCGLKVVAWIKNIVDKRYFTSSTDLSSAASFGYIVTINGVPRTYGFSISKNF
jgi:iron complex outermembrane receptor protein